MKIAQTISEPLSQFAKIWPEISDEDRKKIAEHFGKFLDENPELSFKEYKAIAVITPLCIQCVLPKLTEENLKLLFKLILQEVRDCGKMFDRI